MNDDEIEQIIINEIKDIVTLHKLHKIMTIKSKMPSTLDTSDKKLYDYLNNQIEYITKSKLDII